jgi:hypothetical protein
LPYSESQKKATVKYMQKRKHVPSDLKPERYDYYNAHADSLRLSFRAFMIQARDEKIKRDSE